MRPPGITGGIASSVGVCRIRVTSFNEAAGYYRRNLENGDDRLAIDAWLQ